MRQAEARWLYASDMMIKLVQRAAHSSRWARVTPSEEDKACGKAPWEPGMACRTQEDIMFTRADAVCSREQWQTSVL